MSLYRPVMDLPEFKAVTGAIVYLAARKAGLTGYYRLQVQCTTSHETNRRCSYSSATI